MSWRHCECVGINPCTKEVLLLDNANVFLLLAGKQFAGSALLGQDFMELLAFTDFKSKESTMPWIRMALATSQMCAPKSYIKDGVSRFITSSDFGKLKQKTMQADVKKVEDLLAQGYSLLVNSSMTLDQQAHPMARYLTRLCLYLLKKQNKGQEGKEYETLAEITDVFTAECLQMKQKGHLAQPTQAAPEEDEEKEVPEALASCQDPVQIACKMFKLVVGKYYTHNGKIMELKKVDKDAASLLYTPFFGQPVDVKVAHDDFKNIKAYNRPVPQLLVSADVHAMCPTYSMVKEMTRAKVQHLLYVKYSEFLGMQW